MPQASPQTSNCKKPQAFFVSMGPDVRNCTVLELIAPVVVAATKLIR